MEKHAYNKGVQNNTNIFYGIGYCIDTHFFHVFKEKMKGLTMSEIKEHAPGTFCWLDLATPDPEAAKEFYHELFGWTFNDMAAGDEGGIYSFAEKNKKPVAGMYELSLDQKNQELPPHWLAYVCVENAQDIARRVVDQNGLVVVPVFDVMGHGNMGVIQDNVGAFLGLWQPKQHQGYAYVNEHGTVCWNELAVKDMEKPVSFYETLFGWKAKTENMGEMPYTTFSLQKNRVAGMYPMPEHMQSVPPHWLPYFKIEEIEKNVAKITSQKGEILMPVTRAEGVGLFAVAQDPQGAAFGLVE
jgi:hypothetical protein